MKKKSKKEVQKWKKHIDDAFEYIKDSRKYIYFSIVLFLICVFFGFAFSSHLGILDQLLKNIIDQTSGLSGVRLILFIFSNNLNVSFLVVFLGSILGIFPFLNAISNGVVLGYVFSKVYQVSGFADFWRILPHGIFELPALFISMGLGIKLGFFIFSKDKINELRKRFISSLKVFFFVIAPLLIVAAVIEGLLISLLK